MQVVILAAGRGTRMGELSKTLPKPLLQVSGKTLLEHKLDALPDEVDEIVLVVGYLGNLIRERFGENYRGRRILYAEQLPKHGTAGALWSARDILKDRFLVMNGDDLYSAEDVKRACRDGAWLMFAKNTEPPYGGGKILTKNGRVEEIIESEKHETPGLVSTNLFALDTRIFDYEMVSVHARKGSEEYGLPQTILAASQASGIPLELVQTDAWIQITSPEDLQYAERTLMKAV